MNIFFLDYSPAKAAQMQCDKHVVKMVLETAQLLCTAHRAYDTASEGMYAKTHTNHPCSKWVRASKCNYEWTYEHFKALAAEYSHRYPGKVHLSWWKLKDLLADPPATMPDVGFTNPAQAMPFKYMNESPVKAYRAYYVGDKNDLLQYTRREVPSWMLN